MRKIKLKIIYINILIVISLYVISFFFKPNLSLQTIYKFEKILINPKINFLPESMDPDIVYNSKEILTPSELLFGNFIRHLIYQNIETPLDDCPKEITSENFRTVHIYNLDRSNFSVDINTNSSPETVQKCFNKIFIFELNKFYKNTLDDQKSKVEYAIKIQSELYNANFKALAIENQILDEKFSMVLSQKLVTLKMHLQAIDFLVNPDKEYKAIIKKNEVSFVTIYLSLVLFFFFFQIVYYFIKKGKLFNKLLKFNFHN